MSRVLGQDVYGGGRVVGLTPAGIETALTRKQLLALRAVEEARLRERWAEREDRKTSCNITMSGHRPDLHKHHDGTVQC